MVDPHFQAEIGGVIRVPWTQLYRTTVNANALVEGKQKHNRDDRMRSDGLIEVDEGYGGRGRQENGFFRGGFEKSFAGEV